MTRRKRRIRSPHPGVVLVKRTLPSGVVRHQARWTEPDTGQVRRPLLDPLALPTAEARTLWAKRKARELAARRLQLESGAHAVEARPFADAVSTYFGGAGHRLGKRTVITYRLAIDQLETWAARNGVRSTADLSRARLAAFRDHLIALPHRSAKSGGRRGEKREAPRKRSPVSINRELRTTKTVLNAWRVAGLLHLDRDAISDALKPLPVPVEQPTYLGPAKLQKLLQAALRHDADTFAATRHEHAGLAPAGNTARYVPIAPFVAVLVLTGMRRGEALELRWSDVDLDALDGQGRRVGEIRLRGENTKTRRARTIGLEVSPALRALLAAMKLRAGDEAGHVFELVDRKGKRHPYTADLVEAVRGRLTRKPLPRDSDGRRAKGAPGFGAPAFDWQTLRSTCATYLTNAPGIFGAATVFLSARQLGHSVAVAERHYLGVHRGIPKDAHTLEAAMQLEQALRDVTTDLGRTKSITGVIDSRPQRRSR